jgi:YggT family protein
MGTGPARVKARARAGVSGRRRYSAAAHGPRARGGAITQPAVLPMYALLNLFNTIVSIYIWLLIASVVLSWLIAFNVINTGNRFVYQIRDFLFRITEPVLRPIRNLLPNLGGIDISPVILILALYFLRDLVNEMVRY